MLKNTTKQVELSVVVPVGSRVDDLRALHANYRRGLDACDIEYEMVYVLDGSRSAEREQLLSLSDSHERLKIVQLGKSFGEATALMTGFLHSTGAKILTLPAYFQIEGSEIGRLLTASKEADMVVARRWPRRGGNGVDRWRRAGFHALLRLITGARFNDLGCGARVLNRQVVEEITIYGDQHRLLPVLAATNGFRVCEVKVAQSARDSFRGRYRLREYVHRLLDVFTTFFLVRFMKKPLRFFGMIGSVTFALGAAAVAVLVAQRLLLDEPLADRPALLLACLFLVLGVQLFALGLLGELIIFTHARELKDYKVANIIEASGKEQTKSLGRADQTPGSAEHADRVPRPYSSAAST